MPKRSTATSLTIPPPVNGWNTKDPITEMDQLYAVEVENYFSNGGTVDFRKGYRLHVKNVGSGSNVVGTVAELALQSGTKNLLAISQNNRVYNATSTGSAPTDLSNAGAIVVDYVSSAVNFRNRIFIKDYITTHDVYDWDGAAANLNASAFTGPGGDDKLLCNPQVYKSRLYFTELYSSSFWFGGVDAITGALTEYDVQSFLTKGGYILFSGGISKQGDINQEYFAIISNQGEVLVYQGDNPTAATWSIVGHFYMPPPVGFRSFFYWGSNLVIITNQGVVLLSEVLKGSADLAFLTQNISSAFNDFFDSLPAESSFTNGVFYPKGNMLIFNLVNSVGTTNQFVMNTNTGSWWKWTGINAKHWTVFNDSLYFAGVTTKVFKADNGYFDEDPAVDGAVQNRTAKLRPAYNYLGDKTLVKQFTEARVLLYESEGLSLTVDADVDYANVAATSTLTDLSDTSYKFYQARCGLKGIGKAASIRFDETITTKRRSIQAIEVLYNDGDVT